MPFDPDAWAHTAGPDKPFIVATLNRKYGATIDLALWERCIDAGLTDWDALWLQAAEWVAFERDGGPRPPT
jgi:hypothetical protein